MDRITEISKEEAKIAAKLYIASLFVNQDHFFTNGSSEEVDSAVQEEVDIIVSDLLCGNSAALTSFGCLVEAKSIDNSKGN